MMGMVDGFNDGESDGWGMVDEWFKMTIEHGEGLFPMIGHGW